MSGLKCAVVAFGIAMAAVVPALAAEGEMDDRMAVAINSQGKWAMAKLSDKGMAMMKGAKPLKAGMVIFMRDGKMYMVNDPKGTLFGMRRDMMMVN